MSDILDKGIFFALPKPGDETCLLTCRPKDVDLTAPECRKLGTALVDAADIMDGSTLLDEVNDPENRKWFRKGCEQGRKRITELEEFLGELYEDGCEFGDNCPPFVPSNHYECRACQIRRLLAGKPDGAS